MPDNDVRLFLSALNEISMQIVNAFLKDFEAAFQCKKQYPVNLSRLLTVHPSQCPMCPTSFIYSWLVLGHKGFNQLDLRSEITLGTGTHIHESVQKYLPMSCEGLVGDWQCKKCKRTHRVQAQPKVCQCGSHEFDYHEIGISYKGFEGHIDTVYCYNNEHMIVDYKSTTLKQLEAKAAQPSFEYQMQLRSYALLMKLQYNIIIKRIMLLFIAKEFPEKHSYWHMEITPEVNHQTFNFLKAERTLKKQLTHLTTFEEFMELEPEPCGNSYCPTCKDHKKYIKAIEELWDPRLFPIIKIAKEKTYGNI